MTLDEKSALRVQLDERPLTADPYHPIDYNAQILAAQLVDPLFETVDGGVAPGSARVEASSDDAREWVVRFDRGSRWSDGRIVTADDAVRAFSAERATRRGGAWLSSLVTSVERDTVDRAVFRFGRPCAHAPAVLSMPRFAPRPPGEPGFGVTAGSYLVSQMTPTRISLARNTWARLAEPQAPPAVDFLKVAPGRTAEAWRNGTIDLSANTVPLAQGLEMQTGTERVSVPLPVFATIQFGRRGAFDWRDVDSRRAVGEAVMREELERLARGWGRSARRLWPWPTEHTAMLREDKSCELRGRKSACSEPIVLSYAAFPPNGTLAAATAKQLRNSLDVEVRIERLSYREYVRQVITRDFDLLFAIVGAPFAHPAAFLSPWRTGEQAARELGVGDPDLDFALNEAERSYVQTGADESWHRVADIWHRAAFAVPLLQLDSNILHRSYVTGLRLRPDGLFRLHDLRVLANRHTAPRINNPDHPTAGG